LKHYRTHREQILKRGREKRDLTHSIFEAAEKLSDWGAKEIAWKSAYRTHFDSFSAKHKAVYGSSETFHIDDFLRGHTSPVTYTTFPIFVCYFLPQPKWPPLLGFWSNTSAKILSVLPGEAHWKQVCLKIHPDKNDRYHEYSKVLNAGWQLWQPLLTHPDAKNAMVPPQRPSPHCQEYCAQGEVFQALFNMFWATVDVYCHLGHVLTPPELTVESIFDHLLDCEESVQLLNKSLDDYEGSQRDIEQSMLEEIRLARHAGKGMSPDRLRREKKTERKKKRKRRRRRKKKKTRRRRRRKRNQMAAEICGMAMRGGV
jgi:hypothetical protein